VVGVNPSEIAVHYAYFHDLVIVGQPEPESSDSRSATELPERVVIGSGRPVLIIPYAGIYTTIGQHVMIAWKAGRECARTIADALPILSGAADIRIMEVNQVNPSDSDCINLGKYLKSHGITATTEQIATGTVTMGDAILNRASIEGADLLIMGACEHGLLGAAGFGEVARHLMNYMTLPVLLSH
jgi:nucleotide-binding universal stress UspA family protein